MTTATAETRVTLPAIARQVGGSLDGMRRLVRTTPELSSLGQRVGPTRAFSPQEVNLIVEAWQRSRRPRAKA